MSRSEKNRFDSSKIDTIPLQTAEILIKWLRAYHKHEVVGLENIPATGKALLVFNHSLVTYDIGLLFGAIMEAYGRIPMSLADRLFFKIPLLGPLVEALGSKEGTPENALKILNEGNLVSVAPGGMREALRPSSERYQILWERRLGFVRVATQAQAPIILAVCPKADDIYDVYPSRITKWAYDLFKVPIFFARGFGISPIPRPVKLIHFVSEPLYPPALKADGTVDEKKLKQFHKHILKRTRELISEAVAYRSDKPKRLNK